MQRDNVDERRFIADVRRSGQSRKQYASIRLMQASFNEGVGESSRFNIAYSE